MTKERWLYGICVGLAISLVVIGWVMTVRYAVADQLAAVQEQIQEIKSVVTDDYQEKGPDQPTLIPSLKAEVKPLIEFYQTKQVVSQQLIESLKTRIETDAYASQKTTTQIEQE